MAMITLWKDTEKKTLDPLLFSREADRLALQIGNEDRNKNKGTQLRRFFDFLPLNNREKPPVRPTSDVA